VFSHSAGRSEASPRRLRRLVAVAAVVPMLALGACSNHSGGPSSQPKLGDELSFGTSAPPPTLNPATGDPAYGALYQWAYDPLVVMQPDGTFAGGLAEKFGYVGTENKVYELTLREGVKFGDGTVLDGQALKAFLDYERTQKAGTPATLLANVESVEVTGPLSVQLKLKQSDPGLTFAFAQAFGAGNVVSPAAISNPSSLDKGTAGAGPYMLDGSQTVAGDHYTFVQNPNYWNKDRQHWKKINVRVISNPSSMIQSLKAGQIQAALGDATTLQAAKSAGLNVIAPPQAMTGITFADKTGAISKPLGDVRVRQALNYAVDRKAIAKALYGDEALALSQYALPGQTGYDEKLNEVYPHDVDKAKKLLADAGYADGFNLQVQDVGLFGLDKATQAMAGQLKAVGVNLQISTATTVNDYFVNLTGGKYPAYTTGYGLANMGSLFSGYVNPQGPFNPLKYSDPELTDLYTKYFAASGQEAASLEKQINAKLVNDAWSVPVVGAPLSYYTVKGITGLDATSQNSGVPWLTDVRPES